MGGDLVSVHNYREHMFIWGLHRTNSWIGFTDRRHEGKFKWTDGTRVNYIRWNRGEANNVGNEDCTELGIKWNDLKCAARRPYTCKKLIKPTRPPKPQAGS